LKKPGDFSSSEAEAALKREIESTVVQRLGTFARPAAIYVIRALPKTRSGKILRRALHAAAEGKDTGDLSTLEDPIALEAIKELLETTKKSG
jgi:propionyl-CoA synthetase